MLSIDKTTVDRKRKYLSQYRLIEAKIRRLEEMAEKCREREAYYLSRRDDCRVLRNSIEFKIDTVDGGILSEILSQKYICGKSLEQISLETNYSKRHIERLHLKALERLAV